MHKEMFIIYYGGEGWVINKLAQALVFIEDPMQ